MMDKTLTVRLSPGERRALIEAIRIGLEDGSLEPWKRAAESAQRKIAGK